MSHPHSVEPGFAGERSPYLELQSALPPFPQAFPNLVQVQSQASGGRGSSTALLVPPARGLLKRRRSTPLPPTLLRSTSPLRLL